MFAEKEMISIEALSEKARFNGVIQLVSERYIVLACHPNDAALCQEGTTIRLSQANDGVLFQFDTKVAKRQANSVFVPRWTPEIVQRRRSVRIQCDMSARYAWVKPGASGAEPVSEEEFDAHLRDLSVTGAKADVMQAAMIDTPLRLRICLDGADEWISVEAIVLRAMLRPPTEPNAAQFPYQVCFRFTAMSRMDALTLTRLIHSRAEGTGNTAPKATDRRLKNDEG